MCVLKLSLIQRDAQVFHFTTMCDARSVHQEFSALSVLKLPGERNHFSLLFVDGYFPPLTVQLKLAYVEGIAVGGLLPARSASGRILPCHRRRAPF